MKMARPTTPCTHHYTRSLIASCTSAACASRTQLADLSRVDVDLSLVEAYADEADVLGETVEVMAVTVDVKISADGESQETTATYNVVAGDVDTWILDLGPTGQAAFKAGECPEGL